MIRGRFVSAAAIFAALVAFGLAAAGQPPVPDVHFTKTNIWYEDPAKIHSTNYHSGAMIPVGSKITELRYVAGKVSFVVDDLGIKCTMLHVPRHTRVTLKQYVDRHFSKKSVMDEGGPFSKFTKDEQNSIKRGEVSVGMSRDAVLMAYGYPPEHKTPSLKLNMWTYWRDRFRRTFVTFKDDKVSRTTGNPMAVYRDDPGAMVPADSAAPEAASTGEGHYTRANIWWEDPKNIPSTNYHRGMIIPAGSKVKDLRYGAGKVSFTVEDLGVKFTIEHEERHSRITTKQLVDRYFSKDNVMAKDGPFHKFTKREQENIKNGTIAIGMCKDAVLMAYGYPPSHKTPSLESNIWTYWRNRFRMIMVVFNKDGRVSNVTQ